MSREDEMETTAAIDREMRGHAADVEKAHARGRAEALEEAARMVEESAKNMLGLAERDDLNGYHSSASSRCAEIETVQRLATRIRAMVKR